MSPTITLVLDLVLVALLVATIAYAIILNKQIIRLRDSRSEMTDLIAGLNEAMEKAELAVRGMKRTASDTGEGLQRTIEKGGALRDELQFMIEAADALANRLGGISNTERTVRSAPSPSPSLSAALSTLSAVQAARSSGVAVRPAAAAAAAAIFRPHDSDMVGDEPMPALPSRRSAEPPPTGSGAGSGTGSGTGTEGPREGEENLSRAERELLRALENRR